MIFDELSNLFPFRATTMGAELDGGEGASRHPFCSVHFNMVVLMNGHCACNVADRLLADMSAMPGETDVA